MENGILQKVIGRIGGMSSESSAEYCRIINQGVRARLGGAGKRTVTRDAIIAGLAALLLAGAAPFSVRLDAGNCQALSRQQLAGLGPAWPDLAGYAQRCPVRGPDGRLALTVNIIRLDRAFAADHFRGRTMDAVPKPVLRDAAGTRIGELPEGFPVDPPGMLQVRFTKWGHGMPHEIRLFQAGESALAPHALPSLRWDPATRRYD